MLLGLLKTPRFKGKCHRKKQATLSRDSSLGQPLFLGPAPLLRAPLRHECFCLGVVELRKIALPEPASR